MTWNRFDLPAVQTIYSASTAEGAYGELLGALKKPTRLYAADDYLDGEGDADLYTLIAEDWQELGKRPPGVIDLGWLYAYALYTVVMPEDGFFTEIEHARTITYLGQHLPAAVWERGIDAITVSEIRGPDRELTTPLAEVLSKAPVAEGPNWGIHYYSKHSTEWTCWAVWLPEDGPARSVLRADDGMPVTPPGVNPALTAVLDAYNLSAS